MPRPDTRTRLLDVAEQLFAEHGIDAVSLSQILETAGQRNKSAIYYHFGSKAGLIAAIAERSPGITDGEAPIRRHITVIGK